MADPRSRDLARRYGLLAAATFVFQSTILFSPSLAQDIPQEAARRGGGPALSFNRVQNAAAIADAMDKKIENGEAEGKQWNAGAVEKDNADAGAEQQADDVKAFGGEANDEQPQMPHREEAKLGGHLGADAQPEAGEGGGERVDSPIEPAAGGIENPFEQGRPNGFGGVNGDGRLAGAGNPVAGAVGGNAGGNVGQRLPRRDNPAVALSDSQRQFMQDRVHLWKNQNVPPVQPGEVPPADANFPPRGDSPKPLPVHETIAMYRQIAKESIGNNEDNFAIVQASLRKQVSMLEDLVIKVSAPKVSDFANAEEYHKTEMMCEQTKLELRESIRSVTRLTQENRYYKMMLKEEHSTLHALEKKVDHPDLTAWVLNRAQRMSSILQTDESEAVAGYARKLIGPEVEIARNKLSDLENRVERTVDAVLPQKYGHAVAIFIAGIMIGFPTWVTFTAMASIHKAISMRQHVLLCNVFFTALVAAVGFCGLVLREDPLEALHTASDSGFFVLHLILSVFCLMAFVFLCRAFYHRRDDRDMIVFGSQIIFFMLICYSYNNRVLKPALLGYVVDANPLMYIIYLVDFVAMTLLTISTGMGLENSGPSLPAFSAEGGSTSRRRNVTRGGKESSTGFAAFTATSSETTTDVKDA